MTRFKRFGLLVAMLVAALALAACGSTSSTSSSSSSSAPAPASTSSSASTSEASAGSCGSIPQQMPGDPDGVLAKFPQSVQAAYNLFPQAVHASAWAKWKPTHPGPYTIYFSPGNVSTPFVISMLAEFNKLKSQSHVISKIITQDSNNSVQTQIQQMQQAIRQKVDLMIVLPLLPSADAPVIAAAGKAGIPVVTPLNAAANPYAVGLNGNIILEGAELVKAMTTAINQKGNLLEVHGIPGVTADSAIYQGAGIVLKNCPNIKTVGSVVGQFTPSVAKTTTLQFLSSHPQPVNAAIQTGGMATGIVQAFTQTGRPVPTIADDGATPGALAYWDAHKSTYKGAALGAPPAQIAAATWNVAEGMLSGRGVKITDISAPPVIITNENLSDWVEPGWSLSTPIAYAPGPPNAVYPTSYLNQFFSKP